MLDLSRSAATKGGIHFLLGRSIDMFCQLLNCTSYAATGFAAAPREDSNKHPDVWGLSEMALVESWAAQCNNSMSEHLSILSTPLGTSHDFLVDAAHRTAGRVRATAGSGNSRLRVGIRSGSGTCRWPVGVGPWLTGWMGRSPPVTDHRVDRVDTAHIARSENPQRTFWCNRHGQC